MYLIFALSQSSLKTKNISDLKIEYIVLPKATSIHTLINNNWK